MKVTREDILSIPDMARDGWTPDKIAEELGISRSRLDQLVRRLRDEGFEVPFRKGPRPIKLK